MLYETKPSLEWHLTKFSWKGLFLELLGQLALLLLKRRNRGATLSLLGQCGKKAEILAHPCVDHIWMADSPPADCTEWCPMPMYPSFVHHSPAVVQFPVQHTLHCHILSLVTVTRDLPHELGRNLWFSVFRHWIVYVSGCLAEEEEVWVHTLHCEWAF